MTATWTVDVSCLTCGSGLEHVNSSTNGVLAVTVARCRGCNREYELTTRMNAFRKAS